MAAATGTAIALMGFPARAMTADPVVVRPTGLSVDAPAPAGCVPEAEPNDRPEEAGLLPAEFCVSGSLVESTDQELYFWDVAPTDGMTTWAFTVRGVPATITSAHLLTFASPIGELPLDGVSEHARPDSDAHLGTPPVTTLVRLAPGRYLVGISRGVEGYGQSLTDDREYWIEAVRTDDLPPNGDVEPNDDRSTGTPTAGAFTLSGDLEGSLDTYRWTVGASDAGSLWRLRATSSKGARLDLELRGPDDRSILSTTADAEGIATLDDLALLPGEHTITLGPWASGPQPYTLEAAPVTDTFADAEPNDQPGQERTIEVGGQATTGRLATDLDVDRYGFHLDPSTAGRSVDLDITWPGPLRRTLCLYAADGTQIGCPQGDLGVNWPGQLLAAGDYVLTVSGFGDVAAPYRLTVSLGAAIPSPGDTEPNDDGATANVVTGAMELSGDLVGSGDVFAWALSDEDAARAWRLELSSTPGAPASVALYKRDGTFLASADTSATGSTAIPDLRLPADSYEIWLQQTGGGSPAYVLRAIEETAAMIDPEPNDTAAFAVPLDPASRSAHGRLGRDTDIDSYVFEVDEALAASLIDIVLSWSDGQPRSLCLGSESGQQVQCREGRTGTMLSDLRLDPGRYTLAISGHADLDDPYEVSIVAGAVPASDREVEPNDVPQVGTAWDPTLVMHGRGNDGDVDAYRVRVALGGQLWRLEVAGDQLGSVEWLQPDGARVGTPVHSGDGTRVVVEDMYLVEGEHHLTLVADGDYTLALTRLGPPDPAAEREPNDEIDHAAILAMGGTRSGRLAAQGEVDVFRFSLDGRDHIVLTATPPQDGSIGLELTSGGSTVATVPAPTKGAPTTLDVDLPQGDYQVWLRPYSASAGEYAVELERADPFVPAGGVPPRALPIALAVTTEAAEVAAYLTLGQHVTGELTLTNEGSTPLDLTLDAATSDGRWTVELPAGVSLAPAETARMPVSIEVPDDAPRDVPVRVSLRARDAGGAQASIFTEIVPTQAAVPLDPHQAWNVPDRLLGGLDVASAALGAVPLDTHFHEADLHDGLTIAGLGASGSIQGGPDTFQVDLAGDAPAPVVGIVLDPLARDGMLDARPRAFELLLSEDGSTFESVLSGELGPQTVAQSFVLPEPVPARHAQLRIHTSWTGAQLSIDLGEWKVIAEPGWAPSSDGISVADPVRGGHLVWTDWVIATQYLPETLDEALDPLRPMWLEPDVAASWVVGFLDDRAARIERLEWEDATGSVATDRMTQLEVAVSTVSPLGPWESLGTWELARAADGTVPPYRLAAPTWARFVRFTDPGADGTGAYRELPGVVRVMESPADASYRSILGEWGQASQRGIFELLEPRPIPSPAADALDAGDSPEEALSLSPAMGIDGRVARGADVDWYTIVVPAGDNTLRIVTRTERAGDVRVRLMDAGGREVPLERGLSVEGAGVVTWTAILDPGTYHAEVVQPILSVFVTFDTSGSVWPWFPALRAALRTFADDITPGLEAVQIMPYEAGFVLQDWSDQPYQVGAAMDAWVPESGSSFMRGSLVTAIGQLSEREGARAILVLGDAVGGGFNVEGGIPALPLAAVEPVIFAVHLGGIDDPAVSTAIMHDIAASNGGHYQYAFSQADLDRAFARMATWMRRPAAYSIVYEASSADYPPGSLSVRAPEGQPVPIGGGAAVELVLDTSGSMLKKVGGVSRIAIAKEVMSRIVADALPEGLPVALRTFRPRKRSCDTRLPVALGPLDRASMIETIRGLRIHTSTKTPIGSALAAVRGDLGEVTGPRIVVLVTDGAETCQGDPQAEVQRLVEAGFETTINIVGFALSDPALKDQMTSWAETGGGSFFDAQDQESLLASVTSALQAPFRVYDSREAQVGSGIVGGSPIELPVGRYRVEVLTDPVRSFEQVLVEPGGAVQLEVTPLP